MNWSWGKYRARCCFLGRFTFDDPQFAAPARPLLIVLRVSLIRGTSSIIKRRYLFSRPAETLRPILYRRGPLPSGCYKRCASEKKVLRTDFEDPSRIAGEIPIAPLSEGSATGTRVRFSTLDRSVARTLVLGGPLMTCRDVLRVVAVAGDHAVWSLKKTFHRATEQSGETASAIKREKKGKRYR